MKVDFLLPGPDGAAFLQEECCWKANSAYTPGLLLHAAGYLRRSLGVDTVRVVRPSVASPFGTSRAMIFSWAFGDHLEAAAKTCGFLFANPATTQAEVQRRFAGATAIPVSECFATDEPLDLSLLDPWPHRFAAVWYQVSSGCEHRCPYCPWAHAFKQRDARLSAAEIHAMLAAFPQTRRKPIAVHCNEITGRSEWLTAFCSALGTGVRWRSEANVRNATLQDLTLAARHGLAEVTLGIEALDDDLLRALNKGHTVADAMRVFRWCQDLGIRYRFSLGQNVGETPEQMDRQIAALLSMRDQILRPCGINVGPIDGYPGSRWHGQQQRGSRSYGRTLRPWADPGAVRERWRIVAGLVAEITAPGP